MSTEMKAVQYTSPITHNPDDPWGENGNPWDVPKEPVPAEDGSAAPSPEELAEILAEVYGPEVEQTEAIGRNGLVLINDPDWVDMTDRNMDYLRHVYRSDLNHADKSVLGVVALHCGVNSRGCTASNETLAEEANIDRDNFRKRLSRLTKDGWVRENGMQASVRPGMSGTKVRHIGIKRAWLEGGS
ncbi:helix-turn-helix domain-containing protein [Streptomyces griseoincarnatus]